MGRLPPARYIARIGLFLLIAFDIGPALAQSPYSLNWSYDGPLLGISAGAGGMTLILGAQREPLTIADVESLNPSNINAFDHPAICNYSLQQSDLSDILLGMMLIIPAGLLTSERVRKDASTVGIMYTEVLILANIGPQIFKVATPRIRPYVYNPAVPMSEKTTVNAKESFFSGHTANSFASAVFLSSVYSAYYPDSKWSPYTWAGSLTLAAFVGYLRYSSGNHFPTDILTGALWGSVVGFLIPRLHRTETEPGMGATPVIGGNISFSF